MDYNLGFARLQTYLRDQAPDQLAVLATLRDRFWRNQKRERDFGITSETKNEHAQIIYALNELSLEYAATSFDALCGGAGQTIEPYKLNIPSPPSHFVGRAELMQQLADRLCTNSGPTLALHGLPGVGKSTLAAVLANHPEVQKHFADGVLWAGLGPQADVMSTLAAWGQVLGFDVTDQPTPELRAQAVGRAIGTQRLLLVLDDAWALEPARLLRVGGASCGHLLTTRNLSLARKFAGREQTISIPVLDDDPAFLLLQTLAPEACAADEVIAGRLAQSLGGLPLALELVGGFLAEPEHNLFPELGMVALSEMADPAQRLQLAAVRLGTPDGRQVSLQETITLSVEQLPPEAAAAFYALGAFAARPATFDLAAAKGVIQADAATLATLVTRSLVEQNGPELLALHQTIADVARTRLPAEAVQRHRDYYLDLVDENREDWQRIQALYPQVTHAWAQLGSATEPVFDFVRNLGTYQERQGLWQDKLAWANRGLEIARSDNLDANAASMLVHLGYMYDALGEKQQALAYYEQALPLWRQVGDRAGEAQTLNNVAVIYFQQGQPERTVDLLRRAIQLDEEVKDVAQEAGHRFNLAVVLHQTFALTEEAIALVTRSIAILQRYQLPLDANGATLAAHQAFLAQLQGNTNDDQGDALSLDQLLSLVRQAREGDQDLAEELTPFLQGLASDADTPAEVQALAAVLLQLLAGADNPDLNGLPAELAEAIRHAFDLPEA